MVSFVNDRDVPIWPNGSRSAFTICDDTDYADVRNLRYIYDYLLDRGIRTTKLVWMQEPEHGGLCGGDTCEKNEYVDWLHDLQSRGVEIGLHNVSYGTSTRDRISEGIIKFRELFGDYPSVHCNHTGCKDNLYWGSERLTSYRRSLYRLRLIGREDNESSGHIVGSPHFWGDIAQQRIRYVRGLTFNTMNLFDITRKVVYHDELRPFVRNWFIASNGASPGRIGTVFSERNVRSFVDEGGLSIMYTHLGAGFYSKTGMNATLASIIDTLVNAGTYFAPVSTILELAKCDSNKEEITSTERTILEWKWICQKMTKKMGV